MIATQDKALQKRVMRQPGGAVLFSSHNGLGLEDPSSFQQNEAAFKEAQASRPSKAERETLKNVAPDLELGQNKKKRPDIDFNLPVSTRLVHAMML